MEILSEIDSPDSKELVFDSKLVQSWIEKLNVGSAETLKTYSKGIRFFLEWLELAKVSHPVRQDILAFCQSLLAAGRKPATINVYLTAVRLFFEWTAHEGLYPNIANDIKNVPDYHVGSKRDSMSPEVIHALLESIDRTTLTGLRDYALLALAFTTGVRMSGLIEADLADLFTQNGEVWFRFRNKGDHNKQSFVKVSPVVNLALRKYLDARGDISMTSPLFVGTGNRNKGNRLKPGTVRDMFKKRLSNLGIESNRLSFHSCRHSAISIALAEGATISEIQSMSKDKSLSFLANYIHEMKQEYNQIELRVSEAIFGEESG